MARRQLEVSNEVAAELAGSQDAALRTLESHLDCDVFLRGNVPFGVGPAGTGKPFLAIAMATAALSRREVNRIILTRPAVEAGERLGFLPGDLMAKVDPYLRPLFDALHDMLEPERVSQHLERGAIEVAPLAFMRGRSLNDSFIILDEAQNTSPEQMKMFLTRLGFNSRMVVTGDVTQVDLPAGTQSGLRIVQEILDGIEVNNESGIPVDEAEIVALSRHVLDAMKVHQQAELSVVLVDEPAMEQLH